MPDREASAEFAPLDGYSDDELWAELQRRGAAIRVGRCYPAMCTDETASELVKEHGYEFGPFQLIEIGHRLDDDPQWPVYAAVPDQYRSDRDA